MKVVELKYKSFQFSLSNIFVNSSQSFSQKEVIILRAKDENGNVAFGEVSPLPGFSKENITDCENRLKKFSSGSIKTFSSPNELNKEIETFDDIPSLKFGLEQVLIGLMFQNNLNYFDSLRFKKSVKVNASIGFGGLDNTESQISEILDDGISTIKLKVGRADFKDDLTIIKMIKQKFGDKIELRLDANGHWRYEEAKQNLERLEKYDIQYIEQPVNNKYELLKLAEQSKINIAPDESIQTVDDAIEFINSGVVKFLILKPSIRLGVFDTLKVIKLANEKKGMPIITTAFETVVGRSMLILLAGITNHNYEHGLGLDVLGESLLNKNVNVVEGKIKVDQDNLKSNYDDLWN